MTTHQEFREHIRQDFEDLDRQRVYADFVEEHDQDLALAEYIRFHAGSGPQSTWSRRKWTKQRRLLDRSPGCWEWDNFLALAKLANYQARIGAHCDPQDDSVRQKDARRQGKVIAHADPATDAEVRELESLIGRPLPLGYREYLRKVGNGSAWEQVTVRSARGRAELRKFQQLSSTTEICKSIREDAELCRAAKSPCELTWLEMTGVFDKSNSTRPDMTRFSHDGGDGSEGRFYVGEIYIAEEELDESDKGDFEAYGFKDPLGMIPVGELAYEGTILLAVEGELAGMLWFSTHGSGDAPITYREVSHWDSMTPNRQDTKAEYVPIDTFSALCELTLELVPFGY